MINVSKPFLPSIDEYEEYLKRIWKISHVTNQGPLVAELEKELTEYLQVPFLHFVSSGTMALEIAIKACDLGGEIITTAFSHISTANAILWANCQPVFVDINPTDFCIDPDKIERAITGKTSAILATHVFGNPCDVLKIDRIAKKHNLKVIYDAAHAFDVKINGQSIFNYGDVSAVSFHATKIFHTIEGGAVITGHADIAEKFRLISNFGLENGDPKILGINGKNCEFHAAMGLCTLHRVPGFIKKRKLLTETYNEQLSVLNLQYPQRPHNIDYNYAYFPVVFPSEELALSVFAALERNEVNARRYFYPSLNNLPFYKHYFCPISDDIAQRILCLPLYVDLTAKEVQFITEIILSTIASAKPQIA